jgi:hypothetical protein
MLGMSAAAMMLVLAVTLAAASVLDTVGATLLRPTARTSLGTSTDTDADCGYNGHLTDVAKSSAATPQSVARAAVNCQCNSPWMGPTCSQLKLRPVNSTRGGFNVPDTSTWGGSVLRDEGGTYWMWSSMMDGHCGLASWNRQSKVVLAKAAHPGGPYRYVKDLWPAFSHEPSATRAPTGEYVVHWTSGAYGCGGGACVLPQFGPKGTMPGGLPGCSCGNQSQGDTPRSSGCSGNLVRVGATAYPPLAAVFCQLRGRPPSSSTHMRWLCRCRRQSHWTRRRSSRRSCPTHPTRSGPGQGC